MKCANDNGYSVIRLLQEDVFYDTYDWLEELRDNIEKIKSTVLEKYNVDNISQIFNHREKIQEYFCWIWV